MRLTDSQHRADCDQRGGRETDARLNNYMGAFHLVPEADVPMAATATLAGLRRVL